MGQLTGDALGSLVEFQTAKTIRQAYPNGVRQLVDGGSWNTIAGQPTDDSEMALILARTIVDSGSYDPKAALKAYQYWLSTGPFDCGQTVSRGLRGQHNHDSQANGALMRLSPLAIHGALKPRLMAAQWARQDAALTHPHSICQDANALFAVAIGLAIQEGPTPQELYQDLLAWGQSQKLHPELLKACLSAAQEPPTHYSSQMGWVLIAVGNAIWQLLHAPNFEEALVDTVSHGGDTDTNAAIAGALLGAVYGLEAIPAQWRETVLNCRPKVGDPNVKRPRPECFWPTDALTLASQLMGEVK
jgi:ADP-ribosylglycohydrolase